MKSKYKLILFDLDGTTANTDEMICEAFSEMYRRFRPGFTRTKEEMYYFSGPTLKVTLPKEFPDVPYQVAFDAFVEISWGLYETCVTSYPHCHETIKHLLENGYQIGVITSKLHKAAVHCIKCIGFDDVFTYIVSYDDVSHPKPEPDSIYKAMENFGITNKEEVLYIGDNESDYKTCVNSGIDCALVKWGPRAIPNNVNPKYWIESYEQLEELLCD